MSFTQAIYRLLDWLQLDTSDTRLSLAVCLGFLLGLTPWFTLHGLVLLSALLIVRVNPIATAVALLFFYLAAWPFDEGFHRLGYSLLTNPGWHRMWAGLYHAPFIPYTRFNNTLIMGRMLVAGVLVIPLFWATRQLLRSYRRPVMNWLRLTPVWDFWATSRLFRHYANYRKNNQPG